MTDSIRYPIGKFEWKGSLSDDEREMCLDAIEEIPTNLRTAISGLKDDQLNTPYRDGGWTVQQVAHHLVDAHMTFYWRVKLTLTEDGPMVKTFEENPWAELPDSFNTSAEVSVRMLELLHERWMNLLRTLHLADFKREFIHPSDPEHPRPIDHMIAYVAWHGPHHIGHIAGLRDRMGW